MLHSVFFRSVIIVFVIETLRRRRGQLILCMTLVWQKPKISMRSSKEWNTLPANVFPDHYNLAAFKARVNRLFLDRHAPVLYLQLHRHLPPDAEYAIANVQCQYDSPSDADEPERRRAPPDHTYDTRDEPPAFIIQHVNTTQLSHPFVEVGPKIMTLGPGCAPTVNVIHVGDRPQVQVQMSPAPGEFAISKRIRRSEALLRQAAEAVSRGGTFQTVSEQFNIPISTIRFFMARKGILPRRRRGRSTHMPRPCTSPEPPFHMQHYKLPDMVALRGDPDDPPASTS